MATYGELYQKYKSDKARDILIEWKDEGLSADEAENRLLYKSLDLKRKGKNVQKLLGVAEDFDVEREQRTFADRTQGGYKKTLGDKIVGAMAPLDQAEPLMRGAQKSQDSLAQNLAQQKIKEGDFPNLDAGVATLADMGEKTVGPFREGYKTLATRVGVDAPQALAQKTDNDTLGAVLESLLSNFTPGVGNPHFPGTQAADDYYAERYPNADPMVSSAGISRLGMGIPVPGSAAGAVGHVGTSLAARTGKLAPAVAALGELGTVGADFDLPNLGKLDWSAADISRAQGRNMAGVTPGSQNKMLPPLDPIQQMLSEAQGPVPRAASDALANEQWDNAGVSTPFLDKTVASRTGVYGKGAGKRTAQKINEQGGPAEMVLGGSDLQQKALPWRLGVTPGEIPPEHYPTTPGITPRLPEGPLGEALMREFGAKPARSEITQAGQPFHVPDLGGPIDRAETGDYPLSQTIDFTRPGRGLELRNQQVLANQPGMEPHPLRSPMVQGMLDPNPGITRALDAQGPNKPTGNGRAAKGTADHYQNWLKKNKLTDSGAAREEFFKSGRGTKIGGGPARGVGSEGKVGGQDIYSAPDDKWNADDLRYQQELDPDVDPRAPYNDPDFYHTMKDEGLVLSEPGGITSHTSRPTDVPRSQALARVPGNQVVDSTRMIETEVDRLGLRSWNNRDNNAFGVNRPVDADGRIVGVLVGQRGPAFAPGLRNFNKWKVNPAAFPDRLPMGDRQPGASGKVIVDKDGGAVGGDTFTPRRTMSASDAAASKIRERAAQQDPSVIQRSADALQTQGAPVAADARRIESANAFIKQDKAGGPPALPAATKRELSQLDDYSKSSKFESIGSSVPDPRKLLRKSFTPGTGTTDWHKEVSTALNKFGGEKAVANKQMTEFISHELAQRKERRPHLVAQFGKERAREIEKDLIRSVKAEAEQFIKARHAIARRAFMREATRMGLDPKEAKKLIHTFDQTTTMFDSIVGKVVDSLKTVKVLGSGAAYLNNTVGNAMFSFLAGTRTGYIDAVKELRTQGPLFQEAMRNGVLGSEFFSKQAESVLGDLDRALAKTGDGPKAWAAAMSDAAHKAQSHAAAFYDYTDKVAKLATYIDQVKRLKKTKAQAAQHVYEHFPNYERIGVTFQRMRKQKALAFFANPFMAFPLESTRILKNAAANDPIKLSVMGGALYMAYEGALARGVASKEEIDDARKNLPSYQRFGGRYSVPLPVRDSEGKLMFLDATYMVPFMDMLNASPYNGEKGEAWAPKLLFGAAKQFVGRGFLNPETFGKEGKGFVEDQYDAVRSGSVGEMSRSPLGRLVLPPIAQRLLESQRIPGHEEEPQGSAKQALAAFGVRTFGGENSASRQESEIASKERKLDSYINELDFDANLSEKEIERRTTAAEEAYERYLETTE